jgi:hypothetical protein
MTAAKKGPGKSSESKSATGRSKSATGKAPRFTADPSPHQSQRAGRVAEDLVRDAGAAELTASGFRRCSPPAVSGAR